MYLFSSNSKLKKILNTYPYFQSVSAHLLKSLKIREKESFNELLPKTALLSYNRRILRDWLFTSEEINTPGQLLFIGTVPKLFFWQILFFRNFIEIFSTRSSKLQLLGRWMNILRQNRTSWSILELWSRDKCVTIKLLCYSMRPSMWLTSRIIKC